MLAYVILMSVVWLVAAKALLRHFVPKELVPDNESKMIAGTMALIIALAWPVILPVALGVGVLYLIFTRVL